LDELWRPGSGRRLSREPLYFASNNIIFTAVVRHGIAILLTRDTFDGDRLVFRHRRWCAVHFIEWDIAAIIGR